MRCISLWQPWASLCCLPHPDDPQKSVKQFETRSWPTPYRGPLLIHAAKRFHRSERFHCHEVPIASVLLTAYRCPDCLPTGAIIGRVTLVGCHPAEGVRSLIDDYGWAMGNYDDGRYAWEITKPVLFETPIPYRGQQGFFDVPRQVLETAGIETGIR